MFQFLVQRSGRVPQGLNFSAGSFLRHLTRTHSWTQQLIRCSAVFKMNPQMHLHWAVHSGDKILSNSSCAKIALNALTRTAVIGSADVCSSTGRNRDSGVWHCQLSGRQDGRGSADLPLDQALWLSTRSSPGIISHSSEHYMQNNKPRIRNILYYDCE